MGKKEKISRPAGIYPDSVIFRQKNPGVQARGSISQTFFMHTS